MLVEIPQNTITYSEFISQVIAMENLVEDSISLPGLEHAYFYPYPFKTPVPRDIPSYMFDRIIEMRLAYAIGNFYDALSVTKF